MQSSWGNRSQLDIQSEYLRRINSIWHHVIHVVISLKRDQLWRALHYLGIIRDRTIELACLRMGLEFNDFRQVDRIPAEFLNELEHTLVADLTTAEIMNALKKAINCFFYEAQKLDEALGINVAGELGAKMKQYFELSQL